MDELNFYLKNIKSSGARVIKSFHETMRYQRRTFAPFRLTSMRTNVHIIAKIARQKVQPLSEKMPLQTYVQHAQIDRVKANYYVTFSFFDTRIFEFKHKCIVNPFA